METHLTQDDIDAHRAVERERVNAIHHAMTPEERDAFNAKKRERRALNKDKVNAQWRAWNERHKAKLAAMSEEELAAYKAEKAEKKRKRAEAKQNKEAK